MADAREPISFELSRAQSDALETLAGERQVRISGTVKDGKVLVDFSAGGAAFTACNAAFSRDEK